PELRVARALVRLDRLEEVVGAPIVQEEDALSQAPQGRGPEFVTLSFPLQDVVGQAGPHVVEQEVREEVDGLVSQRLHGRVARRQRRRVTERTPDAHEQTAAVTDRGRATGCGQRRSGGRQESLEEGEL